ncbi:MAG: GCN5-related N-acetyltransferase [Frankiales bacterium]|nr:GCN5-related N-acetyltransferase [Frankiales bacterium]
MIRAYDQADWLQVWPIIQHVVRLGDTFCYDPLMTESEARAIWIVEDPAHTSRAET